LRDGKFAPESDAVLSYRRTLANQRPYGLLLNADFGGLSSELVERYFQIALFYGFYPSMFSNDAATDPYWKDSSLYDRDRDLFKRYVPLIRRLNVAGWQPLTYATTDQEKVYIERFGDWPDLCFTLRNILTVTTPVTVTLQADLLDLPDEALIATAVLAKTQHPLSAPGNTRTLTVTLTPDTTKVLCVNGVVGGETLEQYSVMFHLGPFTVTGYTVLVSIGLLSGAVIACWVWKRRMEKM
jgi:hypothetical protein